MIDFEMFGTHKVEKMHFETENKKNALACKAWGEFSLYLSFCLKIEEII